MWAEIPFVKESIKVLLEFSVVELCSAPKLIVWSGRKDIEGGLVKC